MRKYRITWVGLSFLLAVAAGGLVFALSRKAESTVGEVELACLARRMENCPKAFDAWISQDIPLDAKEFERTNCTAYSCRKFTQTNTGDEVYVYVILGRSRHVAVESPFWGYVWNKLAVDDETAIVQLELRDASAHLTTLSIKDHGHLISEGDHLRLYWTYSTDGIWLVPTSPKKHFADRAALVKVYFSVRTNVYQLADESCALPFAREYLPRLNRTLFLDHP